jgi:DNA polymerase-3 subunit delta
LDKKSKLRVFFEKNSNTICIPFYEDNVQTLDIIANNFIKEKKINLSQENLNLIIDRARGNRVNLKNELEKIELLAETQKIIDINHILKLSNLSENYDFSELIDSSLSKNKKKLIKILNENNFVSEDCIVILRILLSKLKRLLKIKALYKINKNIDGIINHYKPPIFWKEKEIIKQQINIWSYEKIKDLIIETNNIEYLIKKSPQAAVISTTNFVLDSAA